MRKHGKARSSDNPVSVTQQDVDEARAEGADDETMPGDGYEVSKPWPNRYREDDWEEGPPRVLPQGEEPEPRRPISLRNASLAEIAKAQTEMLVELTCEAHCAAMDLFEIARGIDESGVPRLACLEALEISERVLPISFRLFALMRELEAEDYKGKLA